MYFRYFVIISPWKKAWSSIWTKLKSPSPNDALCKVWLKLAKWFLRSRFLNFANLFSLFRNFFHLEQGVDFYFSKLEFPLYKDALCQVWLKLAQWFLRRRWKCEKFTDRRTTDNRRSEKLTWAFSSGDLNIYCICLSYLSINSVE